MRVPNCIVFTIYLITAYANTKHNQFSPSVFIFYDEGDRLQLHNEITTLKFWCSGSIIAPTWILTTATCFHTKEKPIRPEHFIVVPTRSATVFDNSTNLKSYEVRSIVFDENWKVAVNDVNLALLWLKNKIYFNNQVKKARMTFKAIKTTSHCESLMWTREPSKKSKDVIFKPQVLTGQINLKCNEKKYRNEFCFISKVDEESCYDSQGSILMCNKQLQSIASSKYGGAEPLCASKRNTTYLSVRYVDLGKFNTWIKEHMKNEIVRYNSSKHADNKSNGKNLFELFDFFLVLLLNYL